MAAATVPELSLARATCGAVTILSFAIYPIVVSVTKQ